MTNFTLQVANAYNSLTQL